MKKRNRLAQLLFVAAIFNLSLSGCGTRDYAEQPGEESEKESGKQNEKKQDEENKLKETRPIPDAPENYGRDTKESEESNAQTNKEGSDNGSETGLMNLSNYRDGDPQPWGTYMGTSALSGGLGWLLLRYFYGWKKNASSKASSEKASSEKASSEKSSFEKASSDHGSHGHSEGPAAQFPDRTEEVQKKAQGLIGTTIKPLVKGAALGCVGQLALVGILGSDYQAFSSSVVAGTSAGLAGLSGVGRSARTRWNNLPRVGKATRKIPGSSKIHRLTDQSRLVRLLRNWATPGVGGVAGAIIASQYVFNLLQDHHTKDEEQSSPDDKPEADSVR